MIKFCKCKLRYYQIILSQVKFNLNLCSQPLWLRIQIEMYPLQTYWVQWEYQLIFICNTFSVLCDIAPNCWMISSAGKCSRVRVNQFQLILFDFISFHFVFNKTLLSQIRTVKCHSTIKYHFICSAPSISIHPSFDSPFYFVTIFRLYNVDRLAYFLYSVFPLEINVEKNINDISILYGIMWRSIVLLPCAHTIGIVCQSVNHEEDLKLNAHTQIKA